MVDGGLLSSQFNLTVMIEMLSSIHDQEERHKLDEQITYLLHIRDMSDCYYPKKELEAQLMQLDGQSI